jgi:multidrug resistance efflux pump
MEYLIRNRALRIAFAGFLLAVGIWAFFPYVFHRVSSSAFVNAELMRVTSPIAGRLALELPQKGQFIAEPTALTLVESPNPDRRQLAIYEQEFALSGARIELDKSQLAELQEQNHALGRRLERYRNAMLDRLDRETDEAHAMLRACTARRDELTKQRLRIESLAKTGFASTQRLDEVQSAYASTTANCEAASARIERLQSETSAAKQGIFLQDGYNDTPYSQQQRDRLLLRKQEIETDMQRETARHVYLTAEIEKERKRVEHTSVYQLTLPAGHVVWTITASPGAPVVEGQTIMDLANCERRFVLVELPERDFESVRPGGRATVRLLGSDIWIEGRVQQIIGSAARQDERLLAAQAPKPEGRQVTAEIALAADSLSTEAGRYCDIGRMAEVRIDRSGPDPLRLAERLAGWFGFPTHGAGGEP